ncbi:MAG TPA: phosphatidate cytidylyltransferase [Acidimicrobiales bacterium]|nr:phosphatidate cytidylyltransferase [Acidimicrobiales bacterium]
MADDELDDNAEDAVTAGPARPRGEGVRIIGAEEAAAALESGSGSRRPDTPRYGDRPLPPDTSRVRGLSNDVTDELTARTRPSPWAGRADEEPAVTTTQPIPLRPEREQPLLLDDAEVEPPGSVSGGTPTLPHWTEPPTGEVPRILADQSDEGDDDQWPGATERTTPRWRDQQSDWETADFDDVSNLVDDPMPIEDPSVIADDPYAYPPEQPIPAPAPIPVRTRPRTGSAGPDGFPSGDHEGVQPVAERSVATAVGTGVAVAAIALVLFKTGPTATLGLAVAVVTLAAVELFAVLRKAGHHPATLLGITSTVSVMLAAYAKGETAIPLVLALTMICSLLWFMFGVVRARPTINVGLTLMGVVWIGFLGSFAALLLRAPNGVGFLIGAVLATVAYDVGGLFIGSRSGRTPLAPEISPNKTWEGVMGGAGAALAVSLLITARVHPWDFGSAAALGLVVAFMAPLGDLSQSLIKRDLGIKDMGTLLPGHGGVMDRFDALLFVLPATYYLARLLQLA